MRWKRRSEQSMSRHCLSEAASHEVQNPRQHRQIPSRTRDGEFRRQPSTAFAATTTLFTSGTRQPLRLPSRGAFLSRSRWSLKARIGHSCVCPNTPESGCTQYAIRREHEDASDVRNGHLCNARTDTLSTSVRGSTGNFEFHLHS